MRARSIVLIHLLLLSACQLEAQFTVAHFHCDDGRCPSGQVCAANSICYEPTDLDDGGVPIPGDSDADVPLGPCNKATLLADDFAASTTGPQWFAWQSGSGASITRQNGRVRISLPAGQSQGAYAGYASTRWFDLSESSVSVRIAHMVNTASAAEAYLSIYNVGDDWLTWTQAEGYHYLDTVPDGGQRDSRTVAFNPNDLYWKVRVAGGTLYFEASSDGSTWRELDSRPVPFDMTRVRIEFAAGVWKSESSPGYLEIEDLNGGVPSGRYCKASTIQDDFNDGVTADQWGNAFETPGCTMSEVGGQLIGDPATPTSTEGYCAYQSASAFDLTGSQATIEVTDMLSAQPQTLAFFKLADEFNRHGVELAVELGQLDCRMWSGGTRSSLGAVPWNASAHRFWRLAEAGGSVRWQVSADGAAWNTLCTTPTSGVDVDDVAVMIGVGTPVPTSSSAVGSFRVDRLNR